MSYISKLEKAQSELSNADIRKSSANPLMFVPLRKLGFNIRPYHYNPFLVNYIQFSIWAGCMWALVVWLIAWSGLHAPIWDTLTSSLIVGLLFGLKEALYYKYSASKNGLSSWKDL